MSFRRLAPYLLLLAVAVALVICADQFPSSLPTHWDASGKPSRFTSRSGFALGSPILVWTVLLLVLDRLLAAARRMSRSPDMARVLESRGYLSLARALESWRWLFPLLALADAFAPVWGVTPIRVGWGLLAAVPLFIEFVRVSSGKDGGWLAGAYVNPGDRRVLVPKASGEGWSLNYARPAARVLAIVLAVLFGLAVLAVRARLRAP